MPATTDLLTALPPAAAADEVRLACTRLIVNALRTADRPLTLLDILENLGRRYRGWTSRAVRHTLAELVDRGVVTVRRDLRPCAYQLNPG